MVFEEWNISLNPKASKDLTPMAHSLPSASPHMCGNIQSIVIDNLTGLSVFTMQQMSIERLIHSDIIWDTEAIL